jgi:hypothetical protein
MIQSLSNDFTLYFGVFSSLKRILQAFFPVGAITTKTYAEYIRIGFWIIGVIKTY